MIAQNQLSMWLSTRISLSGLYETAARYVLGLIYLHGAVDGALQIFFHIYYTRELPTNSFVGAMQHTTYFWGFMKLCQLLGAASLLMNYKPALGLTVLAPISVVLCLFYLFDVHWYGYVVLIAGSSLILLKAYWRSFRPLWEDYS